MKLPMVSSKLWLAAAATGLGLVACSATAPTPTPGDFQGDDSGTPPGSSGGGGDASVTPPPKTLDASAGGGNDGSSPPPTDASPPPSPVDAAGCTYKDDPSFCACLGQFNCGGITTPDATGTFHSVYCGACPANQFCTTASSDVAVGQCGGSNPLAYEWQRQKIDMLVAIGENENTNLNYDYCQNINDGRGYTIGKVGFCSGTGDFVIVAACYNDKSPSNILSKYWPALTYYADQYITANTNQADTSKLDGLGTFCADVAKAAADPVFTGCQDAMANADYMSPAAAHATQMHLTGALTIGFLYDTELNFGENDDPPTPSGKPGAPGALTMISRANADYGAGMPSDFTGKPWEESRWLGFLIKERALAMSQNKTWRKDMDQDATWEAARRLHTGASSGTESATDLTMQYDITSAYKAGAANPTPCWGAPPLASNIDTQSTVYTVSIDKSASATDQTKWKAVGTMGAQTYQACPANPTP